MNQSGIHLDIKDFNLLVVDDDSRLNQLIVKILAKLGYHTQGFLKGGEAVDFIIHHPNCILILDQALPDMTGREIIQRLNDKGIKIPFIVMTGQGDERLAVEMMKLGAVDYLVKDTEFLDILPGVLERLCHTLYTEHRLKKTEEVLRQQNELLLKLNEFSIDLAYTPPEDVYPLIISALRNIFQVKVAGITSFNESTREMVLEYTSLSMDDQSRLSNLLGRKLQKTNVKISDQQYKRITSEIVGLMNSVNELTLGTIPDFIGKPIERLLNAGWFFAIALMSREKLFGSMIIVGEKNQVPPEREQVSAFAGIVSNALSRKRAEETLREKEHFYQEIFESSGDGLVILDPDSLKYLDVNHTFLKMYGFRKKEEALTCRLEDLCAVEDGFDLSKVQDFVTRAGDDRTNTFEWLAKKITGEKFWVEVTFRTIEVGGENRILSNIRDIHERKLAQKQKLEHEKLLARSQELAHVGSWELSTLNQKIKWSDEVYRIFDLDSKSYKPSFDSFLKYVHPDDRTAVAQLYQSSLRDALEGFETEHRIVRETTGEVRYVHEKCIHEKNKSGEIFRSIGIVQDITERKLAEEKIKKLSSAVEQGPAIVIITDLKGDIEYVNPKFTEITGYTFAEVQSRNPRILKSGLVDDKDYKQLWETITSGKAWRGEFYNRRKDGSLYWEFASISPIFNDLGKITHFIAVKEDITERKKTEVELLLAKEKAEESNRLKTAFFHNMSHEIRTPLNAIVGFSDRLNNPNMSEEKRKLYTKIIAESSYQLLSIVSDILTISALDTGQESIVPDEFLLNALITETEIIFKEQVQKKDIRLISQPGLPEKDSKIIADKYKLNQILNNLLSNAIKFTHNGSVEFGYSLKEQKNHRELEFYVKDTGIGIAKDKQQVIFDRFVQAEDSIHVVYGGTGLGLSICKGFVEMMGGKIRVESELNKGSNFFFTIPYHPVNDGKIENKRNEPAISGNNHFTVLVAEDQEFNFYYIEELFIDIPCRIIHAWNGEEAVNYCRNNPDIGMVLMDIKMPLIDGYEATRTIKEFWPELPIIAQTAYATEDEVKRFAEIFDDYITKPFSEKRIKEIVAKYCK